MTKGKATVLFSGGIDSTSCAHLLKSDGYHVTGLFINFGQAGARMERRAVEALSRHLSITTTIIDLSDPKGFGRGELTGRNAFLIFTALLHGRCPNGILAIGIHAGTPYYDCSQSFFARIDPLVQECTSGQVSLVAPFLNWAKDDVYSYFLNSGLPIAQAYSCETGTDLPCGECLSCKDRERV